MELFHERLKRLGLYDKSFGELLDILEEKDKEIARTRSDCMTLTLRLYGEPLESMSPETIEVMGRWKPLAAELIGYYPAGFKSIGWGWNFAINPLPPDISIHLKARGSITKAMAEELLDIAVSRSIADCRRLYPDFDSYSENRRNALTDMMYNMGYSTLSKFRIGNRFVREQKWQEAADNFMQSKWYRQVGRRGVTICDLLRYG